MCLRTAARVAADDPGVFALQYSMDFVLHIFCHTQDRLGWRILEAIGDEIQIGLITKALPRLAGNSVVMLSEAKHPNGESCAIYASGIPHPTGSE